MIAAERLAMINAAATRIRAVVPIAGEFATHGECVARHLLVFEEITRYGLWSPHPNNPELTLPSKRAWHHVMLADHQMVGLWAHSDSEAALWCAIWWGGDALEADVDLKPDGAAVTLW